MYEFNPYYTADGSVGLYSNNYDDIFHSATGALTESYEKFIYQIDWNNLLENKNINILDICYGIGYNSKSFLNFIYNIYQKNYFSKNNTDTIYTDKIDNSLQILYLYIDMIRSDNINNKICIDAVDLDKNLFYISPFIKMCVANFKKYNTSIPDKILKYFEKPIEINNLNNNKFIEFFILLNLIKNDNEILTNKILDYILNNEEYAPFFDLNICHIFKDIQLNRYKYLSGSNYLNNLHNIYYNHISNNNKRDVNTYLLQHCTFNQNYIDAREFIKNSNKTYNVIFLDAFTPSKCPCLWSYEFFEQLFNHMNGDSILLTYSTSASIRSAMLKVGFKIGNTKNAKGDIVGTIASKNKNAIKHKLSQYDFGLLKTKAGIYYRDKYLTGQNETIINSRKNEVLNSTLQSSSQYKKTFKN